MVWPTGSISQANVDADTDSPLSARGDINTCFSKVNDMISASPSTTNKGPIIIASDAEGLSGVVTTKAMTPASTRYVLDEKKVPLLGQEYNITGAVSAVTFGSVDFPSSIDKFKLVISNLEVNTTAVLLLMQLSTDNGSTWISTGYETSAIWLDNDSSTVNADISTGSYGRLTHGSMAASANMPADLEIMMYGFTSSTERKRIQHTSSWERNTGGACHATGCNINTGTTAINAIKIYASSGNLTAGKFQLFRCP